MLSSLLVRLAMVAITMAVVCWIGWTVPASRDVESLAVQEPRKFDHSSGLSPQATTQQAPIPSPPRQRHENFSGAAPAKVTLDVNRATEQDFERLPGIGPVLARRIVQYREAQGTFSDVDQLRHVKGIGKKTFERIRAFVVVVPPAVTRAAEKTV